LAGRLLSSSFAVRNQFDDWLRTHEAALQAARSADNRDAEATLLVGLGQLAYEQDSFEEALSHLAHAAQTFDEVGNIHGRAIAQAISGVVYREQGRYADALTDLQLALPVLEDRADVPALASISYGLGCLDLEQGRLPEGMVLLERALDQYRSAGQQRGEGFVLRAIGLVHRAGNEWRLAATTSERAVSIFRDLGDEVGTAYATQSLAKAWFRQGIRTREAGQLLDAALDACERLHDTFGIALVLRTRGELHLSLGDLDEADADLQRSLRRWDSLELPVWKARTWRDQADVLAARGRHDEAVSLRAEALDVMRRCGVREADELAVRLPR
jgi:tetratricopeptide (TPR) repeat protein